MRTDLSDERRDRAVDAVGDGGEQPANASTDGYQQVRPVFQEMPRGPAAARRRAAPPS